MKLELITAPTIEPVDLIAAKLHLRIEPDAIAEEELLESLIATAREQVETITRRALLTQTWDYSIDRWPAGPAIVLPFGNLQNAPAAVPSTAPVVSWRDPDGASTALIVTTDYLVETNGDSCGRILLPYGGTWPTGSLYPSNPITVRFVCGWTSAALVPSTIKAAVLMTVAKLYESRGEDTVGQTVSEDKTVDRLLASARLWNEI